MKKNKFIVLHIPKNVVNDYKEAINFDTFFNLILFYRWLKGYPKGTRFSPVIYGLTLARSKCTEKKIFDSNEKLKHDWFNETVSNIEKKKFSNYIMKYIRKFPNNLSFFSFLSRGLSILSMCKSIERKYIKIEDLDNSEFCKSCKIAYKIVID